MVPIPDVIDIFEKLLVIYTSKSPKNTEKGLCYCAYVTYSYSIYNVFVDHYRNFLTYKYRTAAYIAPPGDKKARIKFLEIEIPYLKNLLKRGHTHI